MTKYKAKPEIVEAVQWNKPGDHPSAYEDYEDWGKCYKVLCTHIDIGTEQINPSDYILTHSDGSISVMSEKEFNEKYERLVNKCPHCKNGQIKFSVKFSDTVETAVCSTCKGAGEIED